MQVSCLLPPLLDFFPRVYILHYSLRKWCLNINHLFWTFLAFRAQAHRTLLSSSSNRTKLALLGPRAEVSLFALLLSLAILNSIISWSLQPRLPPTLKSLTRPSLLIQGLASLLSLLVLQPAASESCHQCTAGTFWAQYAWLCDLSNYYQGGWSYPWPQGYEILGLLSAVYKRPHWQLSLGLILEQRV